MTFNHYLSMHRKDTTDLGKMVHFILTTLEFPYRGRGMIEGLDYFIENNMLEFAEIYKSQFQIYRVLPAKNTMEIAQKLCTRRLRMKK